MSVASGCGEQEVGVASGSGWNIWVWLLGVVVRRYIDFLILLIPTHLVSVLFYSIPTFCSFKKMFFVLYKYGQKKYMAFHIKNLLTLLHYEFYCTALLSVWPFLGVSLQ